MIADRRAFVFAFLVFAAVSCGPPPRETRNAADPWHRGRLKFPLAWANTATPMTAVPGLAPVFPGKPNDALVFAPASANQTGAPLLVLLHGAGGDATLINRFTGLAQETGVIIVAPKSVGVTWDSMTGAIGPDVENIDRVLNRVARTYSIDRKRISIAGFSDGASYALALGRLNGTLFRSIVGFSPGVLLPVSARGSPPIFISHGIRDATLGIANTSRMHVPELKRQGYRVEYHEFDGPHTIPPEVARMAMKWMAEH